MNGIRNWCKAVWNLEKTCTIDEMMIWYKGTCCLICQYMPNKPEKWGLKVWCLACSASKYVSNFEVYCGKETPPIEPGHAQEIPNPNIVLVRRGEPRLAHNVVSKMLEGVANVKHLMVLDNVFQI